MNHNDIPPTEKEQSFGPGGHLRAERVRQSLEIDDIVAKLKLSRRQVEALESDRYHDLPGTTFVRGFIRNYAKLLGVDPNPLLEQLESLLPRESVSTPVLDGPRPKLTVQPGYPMRSDRSPLLAWAGFLAAAVLGGGGFYFFVLRPVSEPVLQMDGAVPPAPVVVEAPPVQAPPAVVQPPAEPVPEPTQPEVTPAPSDTAPAAATAAEPVPATPVTPAEPVAPTAPVTESVAKADGGELKLNFDGDSWVEIRDADGKRLVGKLYQSGNEETLQGKPPFKLVIGNAAQVKLTYNGRPVDLAPHVKINVARLDLQ